MQLLDLNQTKAEFIPVMLNIRKEQMKVLNAYSSDTFFKKLRHYLVDKYPVEFDEIGSENTDHYLETLMEKAKRYEIRIQKNIAEFGEFCVLYGVNFEKKEGFERTHQILTNNKMVEGTKLLQLRTFFKKMGLTDNND